MYIYQRYIRKVLMATVLLLSAGTVFAQEHTESTQAGYDSDEVKIKLETLMQLKEDQKRLSSTMFALDSARTELKKANHQVDSLKRIVKDLSVQMNVTKQDKEKILHDLEKLRAKPIATDKHLIYMAQNFLYIPYEAYSVDSIAIPAFNYVQSKELKQKYHNRIEVLSSYREDVKSLVELLGSPNFGKNKLVAGNSLDKLKATPVYNRYHAYEWLQGSFLYNKIALIEERLLSVMEGRPASGFKDIQSELEKCL